MMHYSIEPKYRIYIKSYGFLYFAENMGKNIGKSKSKNLSSKCSQKLLDHAKQSTTDTLKFTSKRAIQKIPETTGDLIDNKIADKIAKVSRNSPQNNSEQLQIKQNILSMIKKQLKRYIYLQKNDRKLLMI